ncbi:unnamed protein product, partial [Ectocarpus sp. 12 AP-2014]
MIAPDRRQHSRSSSVGSLSAAVETVSLVASEGEGRNWAGAGGYGVPFPATLSSSPRGSDLSSTYQQRRKADRSHDSSTTAATPPLASPASSALSLPVSRSWEQSSALPSARLGSGSGGGIGIGFSSKRQQPGRGLATGAPKSRTPTAASMLRQDGGWHDTGGHGGKKEVGRKEGTPRSRQTPPTTGKKSPSGFDNSGGGGDRGEVDARPSRRSVTGTSPRDRRQRIGRPPSPSSSLSPRLPSAAGGAVGRRQTAATATAVATTTTASAVANIASVSPPSSAALRPYELMAQRAKKAAEPTPLQLPASSTARMEKAAAHGVGGRGVGEAGDRRDLPSEALSHGDGEPEPVRELHGLQTADGCGPREEPALLRTPGCDKTGRTHRAYPSPAKSRNGSRRAARRGDSGSRSFSRRRHRPNGEKKKSPAGVAPGRGSTPQGSKVAGVADQAGVFSDDGDDGIARSSRRAGGGGKGPSRQPPVRKLSHEAATMFGFLEEEEDGGGGEAEAKTEQRLNSWDRRPKSMNAADISAVDSIGANAMAFFEKKRLQKKQSGGGRSGNGSAVAGSPIKVKKEEEKKEDEAESNSLLRNWQLQALPRQEGAVDAKPGEEYDALAAAVVAPADHAKGPAHADSQMSRTPRELGSTGGDAWQTREAILVTPPRGNGGCSAASGEAGGRAARAVVVEPSNSWCATTGAVAHASVPFEHASPPMWKPFRPIVCPDAAAAVAGGALRAGAKEVKVPHSTTLEPSSLGPYYAPGGGNVARPAVDALACSLGNGNTDAVGEEDTAETCECPLGKGRADVVGTSNGVIGKGGGATAAGWAGARRTEERQRLRKEQLDLVKRSDKTPMTLPVMDGSTHAPEADDFSEMAMSVGPEKSRRSKQKALASPAAAAAVMSRDDDNGGVQIGQASGATATTSAVSP